MSQVFPSILSGAGGLAAYVAAGKPSIDRHLAESGAVLFRGFDVPDAKAFDAVVGAYGEPNFAYSSSLSNAVRLNVTERVFTANEAPPSTEIYFHHEMAQTPKYPGKLFFFCEVAPESGGATPLCRSDLLVQQLDKKNPKFVAALETQGVRYTNTMPGEDDPGSGQGRSWRSTLRVDSRTDAETRLSELQYEWSWDEKGNLRVRTPVLPAIRHLPDGRRSFFNQLIAAYLGWSDSRNVASRSVRLGGGEEISRSDMEDAIALAEELAFDLEWRPGDVALIDNYVVMHGRRPFEGRRRVLASLID